MNCLTEGSEKNVRQFYHHGYSNVSRVEVFLSQPVGAREYQHVTYPLPQALVAALARLSCFTEGNGGKKKSKVLDPSHYTRPLCKLKEKRGGVTMGVRENSRESGVENRDGGRQEDDSIVHV